MDKTFSWQKDENEKEKSTEMKCWKEKGTEIKYGKMQACETYTYVNLNAENCLK